MSPLFCFFYVLVQERELVIKPPPAAVLLSLEEVCRAMQDAFSSFLLYLLPDESDRRYKECASSPRVYGKYFLPRRARIRAASTEAHPQ